LVIPEVNAGALSRNSRLIAGPNCTMTGLAVAGSLLHERFKCVAARVASYQAVSGAGRAALEEFFSQSRHHARQHKLEDGRAPIMSLPAHRVLPAPISGNVIPQVGGFDALGNTSEENKVAAELKKIWDAPKLSASVTAVRVPVSRGHSLAAWLEFARPVSVAQARAALKKTPGLVFSENGSYPTPLSAGGKHPVYAGRLRQGAHARELCLWIVSDNLLKGAALNSVQIAEELLRRGWLKRA
jgi:aspartate-semialdehyde dehydrogenase